jgi:hypothetical protein
MPVTFPAVYDAGPVPNRSDVDLLSAATATGAAKRWGGGQGVFTAWGSFTGGGSCKLQFSYDEVTWFDVDKSGDTYVTLSAAGSGEFELPPCSIRAAITGTVASVSANAKGTGR